MKVSKPVLILCIVLLLLTGYIHFFTGKKKTKGPVAPVPPAKTQAQPVAPAAQPVAPVPPGQASLPDPAQPDASLLTERPQFDKIKANWTQDPFLLPKIKRVSTRESGSAVRLVAILERGTDRVAVIDRDVVKKGDIIGNEKVVEIGKDRVVLVRGGVRRTLVLADVDTVTMEETPATKTTDTERGK